MKKILGISLCALFAVSAANANIASQGYVDQKVEGMNLARTGEHYVKYVKQENGTVTAEGEEFANSVSSDITTNAPTSAAVASHVKTTIEALDFTATTNNQYVTGVSQADGKVTATGADFANSVTEGGDNAPKSRAVKSYVESYVATEVQNATPNITSGRDNGTIAVNGTDVEVTGLDALAFKATVGTNDIEANAVTETQIKDSAVTTNKIGASAVTEAKLANGAVTTNKIATDAVTETQIKNGAVTSTKIYDGAVTDVKLADNAVITAKINDDAVTLDKIAENAVTTAQIVNGTIIDEDINDEAAIKPTKIAFEQSQKDALNSGITEALVGKIGTNETNISTILGYLRPAATNTCSQGGCTLVFDGTNYRWEKITRGTTEVQEEQL